MRRGKNSNKRQNIKDRSGPAKPVVPINLSEPEYLILTTKIYKSISYFLGIGPRSKKGYKICAPINSSVWICISIYQFILPRFVFLEEYSNHHLFFCSIPEPVYFPSTSFSRSGGLCVLASRYLNFSGQA